MYYVVIMNKLLIQSPKFNRINVTLPKETVYLLDKVSEKGGRSRLINNAVRFYVNEIGKKKKKSVGRRYKKKGKGSFFSRRLV